MGQYQEPVKLSDAQRRARYRLRKATMVALVAAVLGGTILADRAGWLGWLHSGPRSPASSPGELDTSADFAKYNGKTFTVVHPVDGDTFDIGVPDGSNPHTRIRFWGMDAPETHDPRKPGFVGFFGPEAAEFTLRATLHKPVKIELEPGKNTRDKYGRLLAWIYLSDGRLLNRELVAQGYAYADPRFPNHLMREFKHLQAEAMNAHRGLWVNGPPADLPDYYASGHFPLPKK